MLRIIGSEPVRRERKANLRSSNRIFLFQLFLSYFKQLIQVSLFLLKKILQLLSHEKSKILGTKLWCANFAQVFQKSTKLNYKRS